MAPRTRSATKPSPGRTTRNSLYGRPEPEPQPRKTRKSPRKSITAPVAVPDVHLLARENDLENDENRAPAQTTGTPWLACRDANGMYATVAISQTGKGVHVRWFDSEDAQLADVYEEIEDNEVEMETEMDADESDFGRARTPAFVAGPSDPTRHPFIPQTPADLRSFDAGSVIRTPVKKTRQLQRSPIRIGDKGIRCLYQQGSVLRELNTGNHIVLNHPVGSSANLSRYQVEQLEKERERVIIEEQLKKLLAEKKRLEAEAEMEVEPEYFSDSGYEEAMETETEGPASWRPMETAESRGPTFFRGSNGELLDRFGRQMFGPEGTILIHHGPGTVLPKGVRAASEVPTEIIDEEDQHMDDHVNNSQRHAHAQDPRTRKVRFGPEGTELID